VLKEFKRTGCTWAIKILRTKTDWGNLVPRINVENGIKLGFLLE
jgi:hypothetical protein